MYSTSSEQTHLALLFSASNQATGNAGWAIVQTAQQSLAGLYRWITYNRENEATGGFYDLVLLPYPLVLFTTPETTTHYIRAVHFPENLTDTYVEVHETLPLNHPDHDYLAEDPVLYRILLHTLGDPATLTGIVDHLLNVLNPNFDLNISENELQ